MDNGDYCDGVEYCQEGTGDFVCNSTGDPCDAALTCDEPSDVCDVSDVTVTVADTYGFAGTIDIELDNPLDPVGEVHLEVCDRDQRYLAERLLPPPAAPPPAAVPLPAPQQTLAEAVYGWISPVVFLV